MAKTLQISSSLKLIRFDFNETWREASMGRILISLKKENGPRVSSAPALGLNTIIFKHVYWYMQQTQLLILVLHELKSRATINLRRLDKYFLIVSFIFEDKSGIR